MIKNFTIYGERCSGTNYIEDLVISNFDTQITWEYGWKHFFGFDDDLKLKNSDNTLFICIVRDLEQWINSFYREKHHLPLQYKKLPKEESINEFLNEEFWSFDDNNKNRDTSAEIMEDRNIYTNERYKNIFELRHTKIKYMIEDLPKKVKNYIFIRYEDLIDDFENTMMKIQNKGLKVRTGIEFPLNSKKYKKTNVIFNINSKKNHIPRKQIITNSNLIPYFEKKLGYI